MIRFFITIWWAFVRYQNGRMGPVVFIIEDLYILFFIYRLFRMRVTMRVLNITRADIHGIIREFLAQAGLELKWLEEKQMFMTENLGIRLRYFAKKSHAYLAFHAHHRAGRHQARDLARHIHAQAGTLQGPPLTRMIALYYPYVALCYFLLACLAFYTLWQMMKTY